MKNLLATALALAMLGTVPAAHASLDFTLGTKHGPPGSPDPENRYITDGENHIYMRICRDWKAISTPERLEFIPPQVSSQVQISQMRGVQAVSLTAEGLAALRKDAQAHLPEGSKNSQVIGEVNDLLPVFGWKSFEVTFQYDFFGQHRGRPRTDAQADVWLVRSEPRPDTRGCPATRRAGSWEAKGRRGTCPG